MPVGITDGQIKINNEIIAIVPNSVERRYGRGEITVKTQTAGNGVVDTVHTLNNETAKSFFKCSLRVLPGYISKVDEWKINIGMNTIEYFTADIKETYEHCSVINDVTFPDSNDGVISIEFEGDPLPK